jgi:hypothetical protein
MTGHARALDLAAAGPAFPLAPDEARELRDHLRSCPDCQRRAARMRSDLWSIGRADPAVSPRLHDRLREVAVTAPRQRPNAIGIVIAFVLLATVVVGGSLGVGALASRPANPGNPVAPDASLAADALDAVSWRTNVVALAAHALTIEQDGAVLAGGPTARVASDPGDLTYWTLEASWKEQGRDQRLNLYFEADGRNWWIDEVRTWDSAAKEGRDATFAGPYALTPLGQAYSGDLDLSMPGPTGPTTIRLDGLRIAVSPASSVTAPALGARIVLVENGNPAVNGDPFGVGGPLRCSGILQLTPQAAEVRLLSLGYALSWRWETATGGNTGFAEARDTAPDRGWITNTSVGMNGELIVFVANPDRPFGGPPREPFPECATP